MSLYLAAPGALRARGARLDSALGTLEASGHGIHDEIQEGSSSQEWCQVVAVPWGGHSGTLSL